MPSFPHPIILTTPRNGLGDWEPRPDLASRAIAVHMPEIAKLRPQEELEAEFDRLRPRIQAALYTALSDALAKNQNAIHSTLHPVEEMRAASAHADPLFKAIHTFIETRTGWTGTATDLCGIGLPACACLTPRALSQRLRVLTPALTAAGVEIEYHRKHAGIRQITLRYIPPDLRHPAAPTSTSVPVHDPPPVPESSRNTLNLELRPENLYEPS